MPITVEKDYGPRGVAQIVSTEKKIAVAFVDGKNYSLLMEDQTPAMKAILEDREGKYMISLDRDLLRVESIAPIGGLSKAKFLKFPAKKDMPPAPRLKPAVQYKDKVIPEHLEFTCLYELTSSKYRGMTGLYFLNYCFRPSEYEGTQISILSGVGARKVEEWLQLHGFNFATDSIPWSDNVLPWLEKEIIARDAVIQVEFADKGYIKEIGGIVED